MKFRNKFIKLRWGKGFMVITFFTILTFSSFAQIKPTTATERLNGEAKRKLLDDRSVFKNVKFRNIGPNIMSGRVVDIDVNPKDPTEFYVAYASGGLWHTTNNGQSFTPIFDKEDVMTIGDIAVNWNDGEIWIGTGESNSSRSSYAGLGVYKSDDAGKTWKNVGLPESQHIGKIILHPADKNIAWVGVIGHLYSPNKERGVYKTTDGGKTWKQTLFVDDNTGCIEMDINPKNANELYACMWHRERTAWNFVEAGTGSGIYKSTDGGDTWKLITGGNSGFPKGENVGRIGISVFAGDPKILYASMDNQNRRPDTATIKKDTNYTWRTFQNITQQQFLDLDNKKLDSFIIKQGYPEVYNAANLKEQVKNGKFKSTVLYDYLLEYNKELGKPGVIGCEVYRSDDAGETWKKVNTKGLDLYSTYGYYFGKIEVSPVNQNKVVINGFNLMMSEDGGKTFKSTDKPSTHPDWHGTWINPAKDSNWVSANDGGCNITYDNGKHWFKANTPAVGQFYAIDVDDAKPYNVYGGLQDNGVWFGPSNTRSSDQWNYEAPNPWKNIGGGDGMQVQVDRRDNATVYSGSQFGFYSRRKTSSEFNDDDEAQTEPDSPGEKPEGNFGAKSPDKNISIHPQSNFNEPPLRFNWQTPILLSRHNSDVFYYGTNKFYRSLERGEKMQPLSNDLTKGGREGDVPFGTLTTISESPIKFGLLYCGSDDGNIQLSKDGGYTWTLINGKLPKDLYVSRVVASAYKEGRVYVTMNGYRNDNFNPYLFMSDDYGNTWTSLGSDLPAEPLNVVREDPKYENIIYVGTDNGLYVSTDNGKTFMTLGSNLPRVAVHDIAIQKTANEIVIGTHGRSIYIASLDSLHKNLNTNNTSYHTGGGTAYLKTFDWKKMNADEPNIDCPPAEPKKKSKKSKMVVIQFPE